MKKIFLYAYDRQNLGDDLFIQHITDRYPSVQFYMWSDKTNQKTFADMPNLKVFDRESRLVRFLHKLRPSLVSRYKAMLECRCDAVVYIGGSIFIEYPNWEQISTWWEYEAEKRPLYVLGANFGPYHTEAYRKKMADVFQHCKDVCFRDQYSYQLFQDVPTVRQAPDILFSYSMPRVTVKDNQVFISVIDCAGRDDLAEYAQQYVSNMAELIRRYRKNGCEIALASFCRDEGDEDGIRQILDALGDTARIRTLCYDGTNRAEMLTAIAESGLVVGTRFHAVILALAAGKQVLPVIYSDKTKHVLEDIGFTGQTYDLREPSIWSDDKINGSDLDIGAVRVESENHFFKLDSEFGIKK